jgi:HEAT repeat protein
MKPAGLTPEEMVAGLEDLQRGPQVQLLLIAMGEAAVGPLARFLLGPPGLHPHPRMLAAEALGAIGGPRAIAALISALLAEDFAGLPDVLKLSEEAVRNCVARELGRSGARRAVEPLLEALGRFHLIEAGCALARFREARAVALLVERLEDSFVRERALEALLEFGPEAVGPLIESLGRRRSREGVELRPSVERRSVSLRLLGELRQPRAARAVARCLSEDTPEVRVAAAVALARLAPGIRSSEVARALLEGLRSPDPTVVEQCVEALVWTGSVIVATIVDALTAEADRAEVDDERAHASVLRSMARVLGRMGASGRAALTSLVGHRNPLIRGLALANLARADLALAAPLLRHALRDPDPRVRRTAAALLRDDRRHEDGPRRRFLSVFTGALGRWRHAVESAARDRRGAWEGGALRRARRSAPRILN